MKAERDTVTWVDVAQEAGVSQAAVSRAFTPGASIAPDKRDRIIAAADRLGYRPNPLARSLMRGRSNIIGVGVGTLTNPFFTQTLQLLSDALAHANLRLMLFPAQAGGEMEPSISEILYYRIDALVLLSVSPSSTLAEQCRKARVPLILYNRTNRSKEASSVVGSNETGARAIAAYLLAGGHQRLAFLGGTPDASTNIERERGFLDYLNEQGLEKPLQECGHYDFDAAMAATRRLLLRKDRPDAIFCANDNMAFAAISVARHEFGMDIGREISIVGYDDVPMAAWPAFSLTSFSQPAQLMVTETIRLIHKLRNDPECHEDIVSEGALIVRSSTRPARLSIRAYVQS